MNFRVILLLIALILPSVHYAEVPPYIESDTIEDICKKVVCNSELNKAYKEKYFPRQFNKAFAVSSYKSGNKYYIDNFGWTYQNPNRLAAEMAALRACAKNAKYHCKVLFLNNSIYDKDLYNLLTRNITPIVSSNSSFKPASSGPKIPFNAHAVGSNWVCGIDYYKSGKACRRVPANASSTHNSNYFYCDSGYTKSGESCIKTKTNNSKANNSASQSIQAIFFNDSGPTLLFWLALVVFIYLIRRNSSSDNTPKKVVITKPASKPEPIVITKKQEAIKKSPQTLLGKKREINKQLKNGLITKRTADSRIKKVIEAEEMRLIIENINNKPNKKKVKSTTKPKSNPATPSLRQAKVVIPKRKPKEQSKNDDKDLVSSETLDFMSELGLPVRELLYQDARSLIETDLEKAFSFALKSAKMDFDEAQILVGSMYLHGQGTTKNLETGEEWLRKAAQSSNRDVSERAKLIIEQIPITQLIDPEILKNMDPKWFK